MGSTSFIFKRFILRPLALLSVVVQLACSDKISGVIGMASSVCEPSQFTLEDEFVGNEGAGDLDTWSELSILVDSGGNLFVTGVYVPGGIWKAVLRKRTSAGVWTTPFTFQVSPPDHTAPRGGLVEDSQGNLYVVITNVGGSDPNASQIFKSTDQGDSWAPLYTVSHPASAGGYVSIWSMAVDSLDRIYIAGTVDIASGGNVSMYVMQSTDGGATFSVQSTYLPNALDFALVPERMQFSNDDLFVTARYSDASAENHLLLLKSTDFGVTWTTLVDYQTSPVTWIFGKFDLIGNYLYMAASIFLGGTNFVSQFQASPVSAPSFSNSVPTLTFDAAHDTLSIDNSVADLGGRVYTGYTGRDASNVTVSQIVQTKDHGGSWNDFWTSPSGVYLSSGVLNRNSGDIFYSGGIDSVSPTKLRVYKQSCQ